MSGIVGVSYIGKPKPNTAMYVTAKASKLCNNLTDVSGCIVFAEIGTEAPREALNANDFRFSENPLMEYVRFTEPIVAERENVERNARYILTESGAHIHQSAQVSEGTYLEAGVVIGPRTVLGKNVTVLAGASIRYTTVEDGALINEHATIGCNCFTMAKDTKGHPVRIPALGRVAIGHDAEIGANDTIARGSAMDTVIGSFAKLDARVHIGECAAIGSKSELAAGSVVAGYCVIGESCFIGLGATIKNRVKVASGATVGMGSVLISNVRSPSSYFGNPARKIG